MIDSELPRNADESKSANPEQPNDMYESKPNGVSIETFEPEPTIGEHNLYMPFNTSS